MEPITTKRVSRRSSSGLSTERVQATVDPKSGKVTVESIDATVPGARPPALVPDAVQTAPRPAPAVAPRQRPLDPFSGRPVTYKAIKAGMSNRILVMGDGWVSTESFRSEHEADFWMSRRDGQYPTVHPAARVKVTQLDPTDTDEAVAEAASLIKG